MRRTLLFFTTLLIGLVMVTGCCDCRKRAKLVKPLVGTEWQLVQLMARDVAAVDEQYTLLFHDNGTITGMGDCNRLSALYTVTESRSLKISNLGSTRRFCPNHEQENAYYDMLERVTHYEMDADNMLLLSNGTLVAIMRAVEAK